MSNNKAQAREGRKSERKTRKFKKNREEDQQYRTKNQNIQPSTDYNGVETEKS